MLLYSIDENQFEVFSVNMPSFHSVTNPGFMDPLWRQTLNVLLVLENRWVLPFQNLRGPSASEANYEKKLNFTLHC